MTSSEEESVISDDDHVSFVSGKSFGGSSAHACPYANCDKFFTRPSRLKVHMRIHTGERPFKCPNCDKSYARNSHLQRHLQNSHQDCSKKCTQDKERLSCTDCGSTYANKYALKKHIKKYHESQNVKEYKCQECQQSFLKRQLLQQHTIQSHPDLDKQHACQHCHKRFLYPKQLRDHAKVHQPKTYKCQECDQTFEKWTLLRRHKARLHRKVHKCIPCDKEFSSSVALKTHMETHGEDRYIYRCSKPNCNKWYLKESNLKAHIQSYHDGTRFNCDVSNCSARFSTRGAKKRHLKSVHDESNGQKVKKAPKTQAEGRLPRKDKNFTLLKLSGLQSNAEIGKVLSENCGKITLSPKALEAEYNSILAANPKAFNECDTSIQTDTESDCCKVEPAPPSPTMIPDLLIPMRQSIISSSEDEESDNNSNKPKIEKVKENGKKYDFSSFMCNK